ncbi:putative U-box domain-containing protein kinase family protein [Tripterygium wilfordii]|uniref:RING-type E3 ubiquitin transferase n=1 Tax=Tripterygium wilfordii TaxID=458696 RepID=A0A7J7DUA1_TRIWF|nr:putative U-box domain-containing protein 50 [Tripterygium wilfordii]KAF5749734.1 putative U-box domain-containing protein kinase family protein [Tripterygium wilfordii]
MESSSTTQMEKVYVALGSDLQDGFKTLEWTLRKWKSKPISIVILHVTYNISNDFVYTPFGKLPASSVSDEKLEILRKYEQGKIDKLLSKYIAFCGKVKAEILKVEKDDDPIHNLIVDLISRLHITKLVMGITFLKSSSWKAKSAISGTFYIHQHKPDLCEFFIISGGELVNLKGNDDDDDVVVEDNEEAMVAKMKEKNKFRGWLGKMFNESSSVGRSSRQSSSSNRNSPDSQNQWDKHFQEIEEYFQQLLSLNLDEIRCEEEDDVLQANPMELDVDKDCSDMNVAGKIESLRSKIDEAHKVIKLKNKEAKAHAERSAKAEWAISLCTSRAEELEARIKEEVKIRMVRKKDFDAEKEHLQELVIDVEESKNRLNALVELKSELSNKLQISSLARSHMEAQLDKIVSARAEMVREIEELRRQRDLLHRRVEFCREKDAIGMVSKMSSELSCGYREYTAEDIRLATEDFSDRLRLKSGGDWTNVYRGRIYHTTVAIKMLNPGNDLSEEAFQAKVKFLHNVRHPHLIAMMGFCSDPKCIIFEYMQQGSLMDILFYSHRRPADKNRALRWHDRVHIAHEVCSGLNFLHSAKPGPVIHGHLTTSNVFLDRNLVAKVGCFGLTGQNAELDLDVRCDIRAFGVLLLQLLTGRNWAGLLEEPMKVDREAMARALDDRAGQWPLDLAEELVRISMMCLSVNRGPSEELNLEMVMKELDVVRKTADGLVARGECEVMVSRSVEREDSDDVPGFFLCPIYQEVMKNPHVAADGFSYELESMEEWLRMGRDTSPMTNLRLKHKLLTPNHTLRSLIQDWKNKENDGSIMSV